MSGAMDPGVFVSAERAKNAIRQTGLTQREVAKRLGIDETKLSKSLAGTRRFTTEELAILLDITGTTQAALTVPVEHRSEVQSSHRDKALVAAAQLFSTYGYSRVRITDIAQNAGISAASVLYHFKSKPAIYLSCLEHVTQLSVDSVDQILDGPGTSFSKLYQLTITHLPDDPETRKQWAVWLQLWGSSPTDDSIKSATQNAYTTWYDAVEKLVSAAQHDGWLPEDALLAETLTALIDGLGIRITSGLTTPERARSVLHDFYTSRLQEPHPL